MIKRKLPIGEVQTFSDLSRVFVASEIVEAENFGLRRDNDIDFKILTALKGWVGLAP